MLRYKKDIFTRIVVSHAESLDMTDFDKSILSIKYHSKREIGHNSFFAHITYEELRVLHTFSMRSKRTECPSKRIHTFVITHVKIRKPICSSFILIKLSF